MGGTYSDDAFLVVVRYVPILFAIAGVLVVMWLSNQRLPHELQPDVLAALSDTEALPPSTIKERPPLAHQDVNLRTLEAVLELLCRNGLVVRWYTVVEVPGPGGTARNERQAVYRRIRSVPGRAE
jgi:hypothetical protein